MCLPGQNELTCLPLEKAGNDFPNCLGSSDERTGHCRQAYNQIHSTANRYRCHNSSICISPRSLCNSIIDCPFGDNELALCSWLPLYNTSDDQCSFRCKDGTCLTAEQRCNRWFECDDGEDEWLCDLDETKIFDDGLILHSWDEVCNPRVELEDEDNFATLLNIQDKSHIKYYIAWYCNRGILIEGHTQIYCFCPPSYYGERCQYQSNRITIIIQVLTPTVMERKVFKLLFYLNNDDTNQIVTDEQITHVPYRHLLNKHFVTLYLPMSS